MLFKYSRIFAYFIGALIINFSLAHAEEHKADGQGKGIGAPFVKNIYVISVGIDMNLKEVNLRCDFCQNDANRFAERIRFEHVLSRMGKISDGTSSLYTYIYTGSQATLQNVRQALDSIELLAGPDDAVLFFYSGISVPTIDAYGTTLNQFLLYGAQAENKEIKGDKLGMRELKFWLNKVRAKYQMVITDAGASEFYIPEFLKNLSIQNSYSLEVNNRKRVMIYPSTFGFDYDPAKSGMLSYILSTLDSNSSVIDMFTEAVHDKTVETKIRLREQELIGSRKAATLFSGYVTVFKEWEFSKQYGFLFRPESCGTVPASRGVHPRKLEVKTETPPISQKYRPQKNHAMLIATDEYEHLSSLNNPVHDAVNMGNLLREAFGFHTYLIENATLEEFGSVLRNTLDTIDFAPQDQLLIFVAGHGVYQKSFDAGWIAHRNSKKMEEDPFMNSYTSFHTLVQYLEHLKCEHILLLMDVCYGGSIRDVAFTKENTCITSSNINWNDLYADLDDAAFISRSLECSVRRYITSGTSRYEVPDGMPGAHSPFAKKVLDMLRNARPGQVVSTQDLIGGLQRLAPQPGFGRFGRDVVSSDFLFIRSRL